MLVPIHSPVLAYLNGEYLPADQARISPFDRGFLFADGVYEAVRTGPARTGESVRFIGMNRHVRRLQRSLGELKIDWDARQMGTISHELVRRSGITDALIYFQVTRGTPDLATQPARSHLPVKGMTPTVFGFVRPAPPLDFANPRPLTKKCVTMTDLRWKRCDIKSVSLLGNAMASMAAAEAGGEESIQFREGASGRELSEGALTNVLIVTEAGEVVTPSLEKGTVLHGITREILVEADRSIVERTVMEAEVRSAREIMLLGTTSTVTSVTHLDGRPVNGGVPGPQAARLATLLNRLVVEGAEDI